MFLLGRFLGLAKCKPPARGFLFGCAQFSAGLYWIYVCLHYYAGASALSAFLFDAAAAIFLGLFLALTTYLSTIVAPARLAAKLLLVYPCAWTLSEWLRATGIPGLSLASDRI